MTPRPVIENYRRAFDYRDLMPKLAADLTLALQSVGPQPELLTGDPAQIQTIPRNQRRQIWIDEVSAQYKPAPANDKAPTDLAGWAAAGQTFFTPATDTAPAIGPTITLTITGRTPLERITAAQLIESQFIQWYRTHARQADRPYEYVVAAQARDFLAPADPCGPAARAQRHTLGQCEWPGGGPRGPGGRGVARGVLACPGRAVQQP